MPKVQRNGYYYFMVDYKKREESHGRRFHNGMTEVAELASEEWKSLPQNRKEFYNQLAKQLKEKVHIPSKTEKKFNNLGLSFAQLDNEKKEKEEKRKKIQIFIADLVLGTPIERLKSKLFYFIHVNYYCKTDRGVYYPAEIAISKFSFLRGLCGVYHVFINPGEVEVGYSYEVKQHSESTHKIPFPYENGVKEHYKIFEDICSFLMEENDREIPPLFTMYDDISQNTSLTAVQKTLKHLYETRYTSDNQEWERWFRVYPLPLLFFELKNLSVRESTVQQNEFLDSSIATLELQKDTYNFKPDIACKYHQEEDNVTFCSQSYVNKWAYLIRDHCCKNFGIDIANEFLGPTEMKDEFSAFSVTDDCTDFADNSTETASVRSACSSRSNATFYTKNSVCSSAEKKNDQPSHSSAPLPAWPVKNKSREVPNFNQDSFPPLKKKSENDIDKQFKKMNFQ